VPIQCSDGSYEGGAITSSHASSVASLVRASRRFFAPGAAGEIWAALRPGLEALHTSDAAHAAGWASLLLPVTHIAWDASVPWDHLVACWAALLPAVPDSHFWSAAWLTLLARAAKHDVHGRADWGAAAPAILATLLSSFELPIGGAQGAPPWHRATPREAALLFGGEVRSRGRMGAKAAVYCLGAAPGQGMQPQLVRPRCFACAPACMPCVLQRAVWCAGMRSDPCFPDLCFPYCFPLLIPYSGHAV
jgi:hypothetical protein